MMRNSGFSAGNMGIPLPEPGLGGMIDAASSTSNILNNILAGKQKTRELDIQQEQSNRAQQELPYLIQAHKDAHANAQQTLPLIVQQYQDAHKKAMSDQEMADAYNQIYKSRMNQVLQAMKAAQAGQNAPQPGMPQPSAQTPQNFVNPPANPASIASSQSMPPMPPVPNIPQINPVQGTGEQQPINPIQPPISAGMSTPPIPTASNIQQQLAQANAQPPQQPSAATTIAAPSAQPKQSSNPLALPLRPNEEELAPPIKGKEMDDWMAGISAPGKPGVKAPEEKTLPNGDVQINWPSGRITRLRAPSNAAFDVAKQKSDVKEAQAVREQLRSLIHLNDLANQSLDILDRNPNATGLKAGFESKFNMSHNPDTAALLTLFGAIQGETSKAYAAKPGIGTLRWADLVKPNLFRESDFNRAQLMQIPANIKSSYDQLTKEYEHLTGEKFEIPLSKRSGMVTIQDSNGDQHDIAKSKLNEAKKRDPGLKVIE